MKSKLIKERKRLRARLAEVEAQLKQLQIQPVGKPDTPKARSLYVLKCEDGHYYIGQTTRMKIRFRQHQAGKGCWFTVAHPPVSILYTQDVGVITQSAAAHLEDELTYEYIEKYGYHKVRGGGFIQRDPKWFMERMNRFSKVKVRKINEDLDKQMMDAIAKAA